jgi:hypothetical protein
LDYKQKWWAITLPGRSTRTSPRPIPLEQWSPSDMRRSRGRAWSWCMVWRLVPSRQTGYRTLRRRRMRVVRRTVHHRRMRVAHRVALPSQAGRKVAASPELVEPWHVGTAGPRHAVGQCRQAPLEVLDGVVDEAMVAAVVVVVVNADRCLCCSCTSCRTRSTPFPGCVPSRIAWWRGSACSTGGGGGWQGRPGARSRCSLDPCSRGCGDSGHGEQTPDHGSCSTWLRWLWLMWSLGTKTRTVAWPVVGKKGQN